MTALREDAGHPDSPAPGGVGLVLIDVINPLDFEGADALAPSAIAAAKAIAALRGRADELATPVIYVNDNHGHWGAEREKLVERCAAATPAAGRLVGWLRPRERDYFIIKPQISGFYATNLPALLPRLGVSRLVLAGFATDICVLFTAADAHMREYDLWVPRDVVASDDDERTGWALEIMRKAMGATIEPTDQLDLETWIGPVRP